MTNTSESVAAPLPIDGEHKIQLNLLAALETAIDGAPGCVSLDEILDQYVSYSDLHFLSEQLLMRLHAYPDYDDHVRDHSALAERMQQMRELHAAGDHAGLKQAVGEQRDRLVGHIRSRDRALDTYLHELL